jgi:hypothetical protein
MDLRREDTSITPAGLSFKADCFEPDRNTFLSGTTFKENSGETANS